MVYSLSSNTPNPFRKGPIVNDLETQVIELMELLLPSQYRCCPQVPLEVICPRSSDSSRLPDNLWRFWVNSRVDIAVMDWGQGSDRAAKLVIECQSWYHDNPEAQERDRSNICLVATSNRPVLNLQSRHLSKVSMIASDNCGIESKGDRSQNGRNQLD